LSTAVAKDGDGLVISLRTDVLARSVRLVSADSSAVFDDNYFDLLPGETRTIHVKTSVAPEDFRGTLDVRSLADAFTPAVDKVDK
jgi:beta-mannosidase